MKSENKFGDGSSLMHLWGWSFNKHRGVLLGRDINPLAILANSVLIASLMPYVSPFPLKSMDAQPAAVIAALVALLIVTVRFPAKAVVRVEDMVIVGAGIFVLFYVNFNLVSPDMLWLRSCGFVLASFPVYLAVRTLYPYMSPRIFIAIVGLYFSTIILQLLSPPLYMATVSHVLPDVRWQPGGARGPNGLCPEPSMLADLCIVFILLPFFFHRQYWSRHRKAVYAVIFMSLSMIVISQSATGLLAAFVLVPVILLSRRSSVRTTILLATTGVLLGFVGVKVASSMNGRGAKFVSSIVGNPLSVMSDVSLIERIGVSSVSIVGLRYAPLGTGSLSLDPELVNRSLSGNVIDTLWSDRQSKDVFLDWITYRNEGTGIGFIIQRMGIFSILFIITLFYYVSGFKEKWVVRAFLLAYLINSSLFVSSFWFVIGCCVALKYATARPNAPYDESTVS